MKIDNLEVYGVIYKITNKINNKVYIGQTIDGFDRRYKNNLIDYTHNNHLKSSILKYGLDNFEIEKVFDVAFSREELDEKEKFWIAKYNSTDDRYGYNKTFGGSVAIPNQRVRLKMSESQKRKWKDEEFRKRFLPKLRSVTSSKSYRKKMSVALKQSKKHKESCKSIQFRNRQRELKTELWQTEEYREKVIESVNNSWNQDRRERASVMMKERHMDNNYKKKMSDSFHRRWSDEEQREKLRNSMKKKFLMINLETKEEKEFLGRKELADYIGRSESYVKKYMSKKLIHDNKYIFVRADKQEEAS